MLKKLTGIAMATVMGLAVVAVAAMIQAEPPHGATTTVVATR